MSCRLHSCHLARSLQYKLHLLMAVTYSQLTIGTMFHWKVDIKILENEGRFKRSMIVFLCCYLNEIRFPSSFRVCSTELDTAHLTWFTLDPWKASQFYVKCVSIFDTKCDGFWQVLNGSVSNGQCPWDPFFILVLSSYSNLTGNK